MLYQVLIGANTKQRKSGDGEREKGVSILGRMSGKGLNQKVALRKGLKEMR